MNILSVFDGMSCGQIALNRLGIKYDNYYASEIDKYAIKVTQANYPNTIQLGDVRNVSASTLPKIDLLIGGSPCFTADNYVMTKSGYKFISDIRINDLVLTHKGRFRKVLKTGKSFKTIWTVKGMGNPCIKTTKEHPFYIRERFRFWDNHNRTSIRKFHSPEWIKVENINKNHFAGIVVPTEISNEKINEHFWYMIGRYTGDGWYRKTKRKLRKNSYIYQFIICCGFHEFDNLNEKFKLFGMNYNFSKERTGYKFRIYSKKMVDFVSKIGSGASNKRVHPDLFKQPRENILKYLEGLFDSDGCWHSKTKEFRLTTTSKELSLGVQFLLTQANQVKTTLHFTERPKTCIIEGRIVNQKDTWTVSYKPEVRKQDSGFYENGYSWLPIRKVENTQMLDYVYNIEVEEDNSYTINNFVVHNCQGFSFAGKQLNFEDERSKLFFEYVRLLKELREKNPDIQFLLENVVMKKEYQKVITDLLEVESIMINSSLVSAQNRKRLYWTNIPNIIQPEDKKIYLKDILESGEVDQDKSYCIDASYYKGGNLKSYFEKHRRQIVFESTHRLDVIGKGGQGQRIYSVDGKSICLSALGGGMGAKTGLYAIALRGRNIVDGKRVDELGAKTEQRLETIFSEKSNCLTSAQKDSLILGVNSEEFIVRKLTPIECERLQTVPDNYTKFCSNSQRYKMLGNGWTVDVITHILSYIYEKQKS